MRHQAAPQFWVHYQDLPADIQRQADRAFVFIKQDPLHPSLHFKQIGLYWSARVGLSYRVLGRQVDDAIVWVWIGHHSVYDRLVVHR